MKIQLFKIISVDVPCRAPTMDSGALCGATNFPKTSKCAKQRVLFQEYSCILYKNVKRQYLTLKKCIDITLLNQGHFMR